jgi:hypothetical protein
MMGQLSWHSINELVRGVVLQSIGKSRVWYAKLDDGSTVNVRSVSNSVLADGTKPRWTVEVVGNQTLTAQTGKAKSEVKFK